MAQTMSTFEMLQKVSTATITAELLTLGFRNTFIKGVTPLQGNTRIVGPAFTARNIPAREDLNLNIQEDDSKNAMRMAVETINEGEVLVIDARGETGAGTFGDIFATRIKYRGAVGVVTDGALRDTPGMKELGFPAYGSSVHGSISKILHHPVDFQIPIACGGVSVLPGDMIVGDDEGIVVIPKDVADEVALKAYDKEEMEKWIQEKVANGASIRGVYPPNEGALTEYEKWKKNR